VKKIFCIVILLVCHIVAHADQRLAIFDYDDRLNVDGTVAKYLEKRLKERFSDISIEQYTGLGSVSKSVEVLTGIDNMGFDLLVTITSDALVVARNKVTKTPFLFTNVSNPLFFGLTDLDKPGKNLSGASYYVPIDKQIDFFLKIEPTLKSIGVIFDSRNKSRRVELRETRQFFSRNKLEFSGEVIQSSVDLEQAAERLVTKGVDAIIITSSGEIYDNLGDIKTVADRAKIPIFSYHRKAVEKGAIASLSSDYFQMVDELVLPMVDEVMYQGKSPGTMPVRFLEHHIVSLNLTEAKKLGLNIPDELIKRAKHTY
jgi:putative ABC transport system substrate-binding protein